MGYVTRNNLIKPKTVLAPELHITRSIGFCSKSWVLPPTDRMSLVTNNLLDHSFYEVRSFSRWRNPTSVHSFVHDN